MPVGRECAPPTHTNKLFDIIWAYTGTTIADGARAILEHTGEAGWLAAQYSEDGSTRIPCRGQPLSGSCRWVLGPQTRIGDARWFLGMSGRRFNSARRQQGSGKIPQLGGALAVQRGCVPRPPRALSPALCLSEPAYGRRSGEVSSYAGLLYANPFISRPTSTRRILSSRRPACIP